MSANAAVVAIVDDEDSVRKALSRLVRAAGFGVQAYPSGADFLQAVEQRPPHCVVLDLRMPHVGGLDVLRALKQAASQVPVVVITGDDTPESRAHAIEHGAKAYLCKPVDDAMLLDAIASAMRANARAVVADPSVKS